MTFVSLSTCSRSNQAQHLAKQCLGQFLELPRLQTVPVPVDPCVLDVPLYTILLFLATRGVNELSLSPLLTPACSTDLFALFASSLSRT
jgi:hypothetical protein